MNSPPSARNLYRESLHEQAYAARGMTRPITRLAGSTHSERTIDDVSKLKLRPPEYFLQNPETGEPLFLIGYSAIGGPDVIG